MPITAKDTRLSTMDREAIQWMRDFARVVANGSTEDMRRLYFRGNPWATEEAATDPGILNICLMARASVLGNEVAGIIARLTGEDV